MVSPRLQAQRLVFSGFLVWGAVFLGAQVPTSSNQPPANYRGPDTYGMCTYVIGDTTYYGNTFYTSSYFKVKAEQAMRAYAQSQANGAAVRSRCMWSFKESDLAVLKETDRRLLGLPGHSAQGVESGWTFQDGAPLNGSAPVTSAGGLATPGTSAVGSAVAGPGVAGSGTTSLAPGGSPGTALAAPVANTVPSPATVRNTKAGTKGALIGGSQQSITSAKTNAVTSAGGGMTGATNTALTTITGGVGNVFHRNKAQPPAQPASNVPGSAGTAAQAGSLPASPAGGSLGVDEASAIAAGMNSGGAPAPGPGAAKPGPSGPGATTAVEGLIADVSGKDVIVNVGQQAGVRAGETLEVMHAQRVVKDPATGKPLRTIESEVGQLQITAVEATSASGVFHGSGVPVVGDKVRAKP